MYHYNDWRNNPISERDRIKIKELKEMRKSVCGIGTRKMKIRLGKMAKTDSFAKALYCAFAAEENSILAKQYYFQRNRTYSDMYYEKKENMIYSLVSVCKQNSYRFGVKCLSDNDGDEYIKYIIYFDLPNCKQISWHCPSVPNDCPQYDGEWDRSEETTLKKLEEAIGILLQ